MTPRSVGEWAGGTDEPLPPKKRRKDAGHDELGEKVETLSKTIQIPIWLWHRLQFYIDNEMVPGFAPVLNSTVNQLVAFAACAWAEQMQEGLVHDDDFPFEARMSYAAARQLSRAREVAALSRQVEYVIREGNNSVISATVLDAHSLRTRYLQDYPLQHGDSRSWSPSLVARVTYLISCLKERKLP